MYTKKVNDTSSKTCIYCNKVIKPDRTVKCYYRICKNYAHELCVPNENWFNDESEIKFTCEKHKSKAGQTGEGDDEIIEQEPIASGSVQEPDEMNQENQETNPPITTVDDWGEEVLAQEAQKEKLENDKKSHTSIKSSESEKSHISFRSQSRHSSNYENKCIECFETVLKNQIAGSCYLCHEIFHWDCLTEAQVEKSKEGQTVCSVCENKYNELLGFVNKKTATEKKSENSGTSEQKSNTVTTQKVQNESYLRDKERKENAIKQQNTGDAKQERTQKNDQEETRQQFNRRGHREQPREQHRGERYPQQRGYNRNLQQETFLSSLERLNKRELPLVYDYLSFHNFYDCYVATRHLYTDHENLTRVQNAIKSDQIRKALGIGLQLASTTQEQLENLYKRTKSETVIVEYCHKLDSKRGFKTDDTKLLEYIYQIKDFCVMAKKFKDDSYLKNQNLVARLALNTNDKILTAWSVAQNRASSNNILLDFSKFLNKFAESIEAKNLIKKNAGIGFKDYDQNKKDNHKKHNNYTHTKESENSFDDNNNYNSYNTDSQSDNSAKSSSLNERLKCFKHPNCKPENEHIFSKCKYLWKKSGVEVCKIAKENNRCTICGQKEHENGSCKAKIKLKCRQENCTENHHQLFCKLRPGDSNNSNYHCEESDDELISDFLNSDEANVNNHITTSEIPNSCFHQKKFVKRSSPVLLGVISLKYKNKDLHLLVDMGSDISLIDKSFTDENNIHGTHRPISINWTNDFRKDEENSEYVKMILTGSNGKSDTFYFHTMDNLQMCKKELIANELKLRYPQLKEANLKDYDKISGIIGTNNQKIFRTLRSLSNEDDDETEPILYRTYIGDFVIQHSFSAEKYYDDLMSLKAKTENKTVNLHYAEMHSHNLPHYVYMHANEKFSQAELDEIELVNSEVLRLEEERFVKNDREDFRTAAAVKMMEELIYQDPITLNYYIPILRKCDDDKIDAEGHKKLAISRCKLMRKIMIEQKIYDVCENEIKNLLKKNYARELSAEEANNLHSDVCYLPTFFHKGKKRVRMIWNAAAEVNGRSLNSYLLPGPNLYNNMSDILFKYREGKFTIKADVAEMFHRLRIIEKDTDMLRFVFQFENEDFIREYKMLVLPFGLCCSPALAHYVKNLCATKHLTTNPDAASIILSNSFVDDVLKSHNDFNYLKRKPFEMYKILEQANFQLLKHGSNSDELLNFVKQEFADNGIEHEKLICEEENERMLGYIFDFKNDTIQISPPMGNLSPLVKECVRKPTRREMLSGQMSIFDSQGFIAFLTADFKLIFQETCRLKLDWDEEITDELFLIWKKLMQKIQGIENLKIPRCYCYDNYDHVDLFCFGDASAELLGAAFYAVFRNNQEELINVAFLSGKTWVTGAHSKRSIPELEIHASYMTASTASCLINSHDIKFRKKYFLTDSQCTYEMITRNKEKVSIFMRNRIVKINGLTEKDEWKWIPTEYMIADKATKVRSSAPLTYEGNTWFKPEIFYNSNVNWSHCAPLNANVNFSYHVENNEEYEIDINGFSNFLQAINVMRLYLKWHFIANTFMPLVRKYETEICKLSETQIANNKKLKKLARKINDYEVKIPENDFMFTEAETKVIKLIQKDAMSREIRKILKNKTFPKGHFFYKKFPYIDEKGMIRLSNRSELTKTNIKNFGFDKLRPIYLPKNHKMTTKYIQHLHESQMHCLENSVIARFNSRFATQHLRSQVKRVIEDCPYCIRFNAKPINPQMGSLPDEKLDTHIPPFVYCMGDVCGPFAVSFGRNGRINRYLLVICCLTTHSTHIEVLQDMSTDSLLSSLQNTINLRGAIKILYSDYGSNFIGASNKTKKITNDWNSELLEKGLINEPINFKLGTPRSSHVQGSVERTIQVAKTLLKKMKNLLEHKNYLHDDFSFRESVCEVINILNNRPLTMIRMDDSFGAYLTPNGFLLQRTSSQYVPKSVYVQTKLKNNWRNVQEFTSTLWEHFIKHYFSELVSQTKWLTPKENLQVNDLVLTVDTSASNSWQIGRVIEIIEGSKNQVRRVKVRLGKNKIIGKAKTKDNKKLLEAYKSEKHSEVWRHTNYVCKIKIE